MFTGLIEEVGEIAGTSKAGAYTELTVRAQTVLEDVHIGDSITINGACQTVTRFDSNSFTVQAVRETLRRTTLSSLRTGDRVNLERALAVGARLGGHIVQGHVDGVGRITGVRGTKENSIITIAAESAMMRYIAEKGSITVDGVSLTVTDVGNGAFGVSVIPHTLGETTLGLARAGMEVNLETDVLAKYVERLMNAPGGLTADALKQMGY